MVNETLRPGTCAGIDHSRLDLVVDAHNVSSAEDPVRQAIRTSTPQIVQYIDETGWESCARTLTTLDYHAVAAIALVYEGTVYGTVEIVSADPDAFETIDEDVLSELGQTIA